MSRVLGIDVSSFQGDITAASWTTYKNSDSIIFAWTKASEGIGSGDPTFTNNMATAVQAGVLIGAYNFAHYDTHPGTSGAMAEADDFWNNFISTYYTAAAAAKKEYLMPVLDLKKTMKQEHPVHLVIHTNNSSNWVNAWANEMVTDALAAGVTIQPVIYTGASFAQTWLNTTVSQNWANWIANYNGANAQTGTPIYQSSYAPWTTWQAWQFNDAGTAPGDQDVLNGDATDLQNFVFGSGKYASGSTVATTQATTATQNANGGTSHSVPGNTGGTVQGTPKYFNNGWYFDVAFTNGVTGWVNETFLQKTTTAPAVPTYVSPLNNSTIYSAPTLTWNTDVGATSYSVYLNSVLQASGLTTTSYQLPSNLSTGAYTWSVTATNTVGSTPGATWNFTYSQPTGSDGNLFHAIAINGSQHV